MSAIRERTVLSVIDLPKTLTSRRNLHAHFSKFGEIIAVSVNKALRTGMIQFSTHFGAQSAKTQGNMYDDVPLILFWSDCTTLDPRAKEKQVYGTPRTEEMWQEGVDDDKEYFGIETLQTNTREDRKQSIKDLIKQHLMTPIKLGVRERLGGFVSEASNEKKVEESDTKITIVKRGKLKPNNLVVMKKSVMNPISKRKIDMKEKHIVPSVANKQKKNILKQLPKTPTTSAIEKTDLKYKLALLDERDKLIRKDTIQNSNIKTAVAIKGTCPDMCPERERILRQYGHAVAMYEMIPGTSEMDESRAVKEYTRSSADQEVPLPHDLRPEPVLSMTMNYLITNIINRVDNADENKAVWYSFCWNRLRSIRKDIILQQLCNMETVTIVEQCARFHISCYDHMWGADISGFDDKINTENLKDCLHTLKYLYEDLAEHGVTCPNKPEFYLYLILLKLKSDDIIWQYQQYSLDIQLSPQVQFGIKAYMAFKNKMYSRYFGLVKKAPYLPACLMQRYFDVVRKEALKIMLKAYCLPNKNVGLSSSFVVSSLKFDSQKSALRFCEQEGVDVRVDSDDNDNEDGSYVSTSSFLIREKRLPIANAIVGGNSPPVCTPPQAHSSFDEFGKLKSSEIECGKDDDEMKVPEELPSTIEDNSDITAIVETDQSTFKFSLSPTKVSGNIFGKSIFSNQMNISVNQPSEEGLMNIDMGYLKNSGDVSMNYNDKTLNTFETEDDIDQDMVCEDIEILQEPVSAISHQMLPMKTGDESQGFKKSQFIPHQPFSIPSLGSATEQNIWSKGKENEAHNKVQENSSAMYNVGDLGCVKEENKETSMFSLNFFKNDSSKSNLDPNSHVKKEFSLGYKETRPLLEMCAINEDLMLKKPINNKHDSTLPCVDLKESISKQVPHVTDEKSMESKLKKDEEREFRALLLKKLLKEEAEQKELQLKEKEEKQRLEKIRKQNEEKKKNDLLRKYVRQRFKVISARKCARQWREKIERLKKTRADFPSLVQLSVKDHLLQWGSINSIPPNSIFLRARDQRQTMRITSRLLNSGLTDSCKYIGSELAETLAKCASKTMKKGSIRTVYWKLGISVPWVGNHSSELSVFNQLMRRWCKQSFYKQEMSSLGSVEQVLTSLEIPVTMSIHLSDSCQSSHNLQGMDALMYVVLNDTETDKTCIQRLRNSISNQLKSCELPIAVMSIGGNKMDRVLKNELEELHEQNIVANWKISSWWEPKSIVQSLHFLADQVNVVPNICVSSLEVLIREISDEFFDSLSCSQHSIIEFRNILRNPNNVIYLYNICLTKLEDLLMSSKLEKYFNIAEEFKTHIPMSELGGPELLCGKHYDDVYKTRLTKLINSLKLPEFPKWPARSTNRLVKLLKAYCNQVKSYSVFPQIIRMLDIPDDSDLQQHLEQVSWLNIVEVWAQCCTQNTFSTTDKSNRMFVVFDKNNVQRLIQKQWWLKLPASFQRN